ncbi:hypothetical protein [Ilumatobacter sp.]|uniref:hypothetical protein n=1 Tax=Ilumatobacter sp. TaxID=1967498 RepID=UPI003752D07C
MSIDLDEIDSSPEKPDFRRANGAPMVIDKDGKNQRLSRPSGWGKTLDDENALVNWKVDVAAIGVAGDKALQAEWTACKMEDKPQRAKLREKSIQSGRGNQASDTGTALHAMSERWEDPDDDFNPGTFRPSLEAYTAAMKAIGIVSERFEYTVANMEYRAAGTVDRLYRLTQPLFAPDGTLLPEGTLVIGDLKTGKSLGFSLPGYHVQMALYAQGEFYDVEQDCFMPTPEINQAWGIIVHMPSNSDTCEMLWCDLQVGNYGAYLVNEIKDWRRKWRNQTYSSPEVQPMAVTVVEEPIDNDKEWMDAMFPFIKARIATIKDHSDAGSHLALHWPEGCPPPKAMVEPHHYTQVLNVLDKVEADYGMTFPENDPRVVLGVFEGDQAHPTNNPPSLSQEIPDSETSPERLEKRATK